MGETMREKKDISYTIRRSADFPVIMIGEGILVGAVAGGIVLLYRICLNYAGTWMRQILEMCKGDPIRSALWIGALLLMAVVTGFLVRWEPMISGSGIPQLKGEMEGFFRQSFWAASWDCLADLHLVGKAHPFSLEPWREKESHVS